MRVILFQPRFAELVRTGQKRQTIRKQARCKPGDLLSLRRWTGKPYRSKQQRLWGATCRSVCPISIGHGVYKDGISVNGVECSMSQRARVAREDGFGCVTEMLDWFEQTHGLPFVGEVIAW